MDTSTAAGPLSGGFTGLLYSVSSGVHEITWADTLATIYYAALGALVGMGIRWMFGKSKEQ
jgi:hypothetical protein